MQLNLALTYASRTQHHSLARNISDLLQQKATENAPDSNASDNETESEDVAYTESRTSALKQRVQIGNGANGANGGTSSSKWAVPSLRIKTASRTSKFDCYVKDDKQGHFLSNAHSTTCNGGSRLCEGETGEDTSAVNETRELFSVSEEVRSGGEDGGGSEEEERSPLPTPVQLCTGTKRANPFKVSIQRNSLTVT